MTAMRIYRFQSSVRKPASFTGVQVKVGAKLGTTADQVSRRNHESAIDTKNVRQSAVTWKGFKYFSRPKK